MNQTVISFFFLGQLLVSESVFLIKAPRRNKFILRSITALGCYIGLIFLTNFIFGLLPQTVPLKIVFFILFFSYSVPAIYFCFDMPLSHVFFVSIAGYSVEHIADSLCKLLIFAVGSDNIPLNVYYSVMFTLPYIVCAAIFYFALVRRSMSEDKMQYADKRTLVVSLVNVVICLVLSVIVSETEWTYITAVVCKIYAILGCLLCLCLQTGLFKEGKMARDNRTLQEMLALERSQHRISKETIDFINIKCHDLKHRISSLDAGSEQGGKRAESLAKISQAVLIYDSITKTGNEALDVVLMEKKLLCEKYKIKFSCMAEGRGLSMMDEADVYALFGNMLDNAIESLCAEPDEEKRVMSLTLKVHGQMLYIYMDNYYSTPVLYRNGEIQTTKKEEADMHGFGIKSINYIVHNYGGDVLIRTENDHFVLEIMLPTETGENTETAV